MQEKSDEYSLSLRPWLKRRLDNNDYACLQWIDQEIRTFKILWSDKGKPGWEETSELFQAWANHKDGDKNTQSFSTLKGRFRDAMRNSNSFDEIKGQNVLNRQTGNYKVYKFLTREEAQEKKKRQKRGKPSETDSLPDSQENSENAISSQSTLDHQSDFSVESLSPLLHEVGIGTPSVNLHEIDCSFDDPTNPSNDVLSSAMDIAEIDSLSPADLNMFDPLVSAAPTTGHDMSLLPHQQPLQQESLEMTGAEASRTEDDFRSILQLSHYKTTEELLQIFGIDCTKLSQFNVTLAYGNQTICQYTMDFAVPVRFVYDGTVQNDYSERWPVITFPKYTESNKLVEKVLNIITDGVVLKSLPIGRDLNGMRLGLGHIYYTNDEGNFVKMERNSQIPLFSYLNYIEQCLQHRSRGRPRSPPCEVALVFGTCPSSMRSDIPVCLTIEPVVAASLKEKFEVPSNGSASILCSEENCYDEMYRHIGEIRNKNEEVNQDDWTKRS